MRRGDRGFTLLELIIVLALAGVVLLGVHQHLASGIRIWRALTGAPLGEDERLFGVKTAFDFNRCFRFAPAPFLGEERSVSFACTVRGGPAVGGERAVGQVQLEFDPARSAIVRRERDWHDLSRDRPGRESVLLSGVTGLKLSYLTFDTAYKVFAWRESWTPEEKTLPLSVRFEFDRPGPGGTETLTRTFDLPAGG